MYEDFEQIKSSLQSVNELIDIKGNPVVTAGVAGVVGKIPVIGDLVNASIDKTEYSGYHVPAVRHKETKKSV